MRTDYTEEQMKEMMPKVPLGTKCYYSDFYNNSGGCLIKYVKTQNYNMVGCLEEVMSDFNRFLIKNCSPSWGYIFPAGGFEALGIYPSDETPEYKFGDTVYTKPGTKVYYIGKAPNGRHLVCNPDRWSAFCRMSPDSSGHKHIHYAVNQVYPKKPKRQLTMAQLEAIVGEPFEIKEGA